MADYLKMKKALDMIFACARKPKYEGGVIITAAAFEAVKEALGPSLVRFADGKFGCPECGVYADVDDTTGVAKHMIDCSLRDPVPQQPGPA